MFPAFVCANNIGSLVNNLFGVNIFNPFPSFTSSSSLSRDDVSSAFCLLNFTLSEIVSFSCDLLFSFFDLINFWPYKSRFTGYLLSICSLSAKLLHWLN